ncbi:MAG: TetR/AcrR family transcriptional regulator [Anaerolineales bacterium]
MTILRYKSVSCQEAILAIKPLTPKKRLLQTAEKMFYRYGYRAIGVDAISAESGIGKMTLYRHFQTKDDLIAEYLQDNNENFWKLFEEVTGWTKDPREKLMAFFQALGEYVNDPQCYGCPHLNVSVEYPQSGYAGHKIALAHKLSVRKRFQELAESAGTHDPEQLANQLVLLMDGAYMAARVYGASNPGGSVASAAKTLIENS